MKYSLFCLIFFSLVCVSIAQQTQTEPSKQTSLPAPIGWSLYPKPAADSRDMLCGNYSIYREWLVSREGEQLKIQLQTQRSYQRDSLPFKVKLKKNEEDGLNGRRYTQKLNDGWIVGFDEGEFGGSLWWFSLNGKRHKKLANGNIKYFVTLSDELFVLEGLAHLGSAEGAVLRVSKTESNGYKADVVAKLDGEPYGFAQESNNSLLIITTSGLRRVKTSGIVEKLIETDYGMLYPNSMVLTQDKIVYIGMRHFITRLIPTDNGYMEEWLVPNDCRKFEIDKSELDCVCVKSQNK